MRTPTRPTRPTFLGHGGACCIHEYHQCATICDAVHTYMVFFCVCGVGRQSLVRSISPALALPCLTMCRQTTVISSVASACPYYIQSPGCVSPAPFSGVPECVCVTTHTRTKNDETEWDELDANMHTQTDTLAFACTKNQQHVVRFLCGGGGGGDWPSDDGRAGIFADDVCNSFIWPAHSVSAHVNHPYRTPSCT